MSETLLAASRYALMMLRFARTNVPSKPRLWRAHSRRGGMDGGVSLT